MPNSTIIDNYLTLLAHIESSNQPYAKNPNSSASGLFQFLKKTWVSLGGQWGSDPTQPFGGLMPSVAEQQAAAKVLAAQNASILQRAGVALSSATLYAAHFLGPSTALRVLTAPVTATLQPIVGSAVMSANGFPATMTVNDFLGWLRRKTGA